MATPSPDKDATARIDSDVRYTPYPRSAQAQFAPGTIIAGRYRIAGILGSGGMGEVYRADDTKLDQPVALKFLPARLARDPVLLARLHDEVRLGRQISHPNVCRIYDIVDWEGSHFVAMEFVDGEDLSRLLRRIGRLAHDKAVDIARGIAAGLFAAHAKGILHRDLKPANVIVDSYGEARIMDFGLALAAGEDDGTISGTPAYMAPEQLEGQQATIQSDLYALGLVMYELFTGKRALSGRTLPERLRELTSEITTPSSVIRDIDPAVERTILRCLSNEPSERPRSAREVIEALPGGDPLAAALAAGETPSPNLVAAASVEGSLKPAVGWTLLAVVVLVLGAVGFDRVRDSLLTRYPLEKPPEVLEDRAAAILREAGIPVQPFSTRRLSRNDRYLTWLQVTDASESRWNRLQGGRPSPVRFRLRQSAEPETPLESIPVGGARGTTEIVLSARGELESLTAVPATRWTPRPLSWSPLFAAAGFDPARLTPAEPKFIPPVTADTVAAWTGNYPNTATPLRVEAAAWRGTPVLFRVTGPWDDIDDKVIDQHSFGNRVVVALINAIMVAAFVIAGLLAWRNLRLRRGDRMGAWRVSVAMFVLALTSDLAVADHQPDAWHELALLQVAGGQALVLSVLSYLAYIALEPFVRRRWPSTIISWTRLLAGRWRDPLIGRDVLIGCAAGVAHSAFSTFSWHVAAAIQDSGPHLSMRGELYALLGFDNALAHVSGAVAKGITVCFVMLVILAALTMLLRNRAAAVAGLFALMLSVHALAVGNWTMVLIASIPAVAVTLGTLARFGLVAGVVAHVVFICVFHYPLPVQLSWWTALALVGPVVVLALAVWGFITSLGGQSPFGSALLDQT